jgi:hypothetical protein
MLSFPLHYRQPFRYHNMVLRRSLPRRARADLFVPAES